MGKNHRHKKDLKAEKAKTKLKQSKTKFLPKGLNVTNTAFKIKPIVLPEQLKEKSSDDILSKRNLNVKDLLSRIKHYNDNVKQLACDELSDMIKIHTEEIIQQHLSQICLAISNLMQDREKRVRHAAVKCVGVILDKIPNDKLAPFLDFFSTNLRCAMTNIDKNIQEDSLLFLDNFINKDCGLIMKSSEKLLPDFLSLISKLRSDSKLGRTLTLNLNSKLTSVTWRIKVLTRLHAVLKIILKDDKDTADDCRNKFETTDKSCIPLYNRKFLKILDEPFCNIFAANKTVSYSNLETTNRHIITLVPLLYETWLEGLPEQKVQKTAGESTVLSEDMGALLTCITNTLYLLWKYVRKIESDDINLKIVFMCPEGQKFLNHLLQNFPYCHLGSRGKKSKLHGGLNMNHDPKCVHENLLICFLFLTLNINCWRPSLKKDSLNIVSYITKLLFQKSALSDDSIHCLLDLLSEILGENYQKWFKSGLDIQTILENTILFYDHGKMSDESRLKISQILFTVIDNVHLSRNSKYQNWLASLPNILCRESVTDSTIRTLLEMSKKNCAVFQKALVEKLPEITDNLDKLQIKVPVDSSEHTLEMAKRNLVAIFYYLPAHSRGDLLHLRNFMEMSPNGFSSYSREIFALRSELRH